MGVASKNEEIPLKVSFTSIKRKGCVDLYVPAIPHLLLVVSGFQLYALMSQRKYGDLCKVGNRGYLYTKNNGEP